MTVGDIVGVAAAFGIVLLAVFLALVLVKLGRVLDQTTSLVSGITDKTVPLLGEVTTSVTHVNKELERVDAITANVQSMTGNLSALTSLFAATLGGPVVKVAAFSYGVRRAATKRQKDDLTKHVRSEMKAQRRGKR